MIDYEDGQMNAECDTCGSNELLDGSFSDCIQELKEKGWIIIKPERRCDSFFHYCSKECLEEGEQ